MIKFIITFLASLLVYFICYFFGIHDFLQGWFSCMGYYISIELYEEYNKPWYA